MAEESTHTVFGDVLHAYRLRKDITQEEFSRRSGIPQAEVSKWETGKLKVPPPAKVRLFAQALQVPAEKLALAAMEIHPDTFVGLDNEPPSAAVLRLLTLHPEPEEADYIREVLLLLRKMTRPGTDARSGIHRDS